MKTRLQTTILVSIVSQLNRRQWLNPTPLWLDSRALPEKQGTPPPTIIHGWGIVLYITLSYLPTPHIMGGAVTTDYQQT